MSALDIDLVLDLSHVSIRHRSCAGLESCQHETLIMYWSRVLSALDIVYCSGIEIWQH